METTAQTVIAGPATGVASRLGDMEDKYLTFWADGQLFGVPIADVVQIVGMQDITEVPEYPSYAKGIMNLRGEIIPVIDVRLRLGKMEEEYNDRTCIIVTNIHQSYFGIIVDSVDEVTNILKEQISPPPKIAGDFSDQPLTGVARLKKVNSDMEKIVLVTDAAKLLGEEGFDSFPSML